jgi:hypothetical protein
VEIEDLIETLVDQSNDTEANHVMLDVAGR